MASKIAFEGKRELRWLDIGTCLACYMESELEYDDSTWDAWMDAIRRESVTSLLICSWGPTQPSHQQWRRATRLMRDRALPVGVITDARHNFALAKAASWLGTNIRAHRWDEVATALEFVQIPASSRIAAQSTLVALRDRFGPVGSSAVLADAGVPGRAVSDAFTFSASSYVVSETNDEIQRKLADIQARLSGRKSAAGVADQLD